MTHEALQRRACVMDAFKIYLMMALIGLIAAAAAYRRRQPAQPDRA
jgi:hypothetical protein